jgi:hypothetical protein
VTTRTDFLHFCSRSRWAGEADFSLTRPVLIRAKGSSRSFERGRVSIASRSRGLPQMAWRVGIRIVTFEACSGFTRVTAHRIAQPPKAPLSRGSSPSGYPAEPLESIDNSRGWISVNRGFAPSGALPKADVTSAGMYLPRRVSAFPGVTVASLQNHLRILQLEESD